MQNLDWKTTGFIALAFVAGFFLGNMVVPPLLGKKDDTKPDTTT